VAQKSKSEVPPLTRADLIPDRALLKGDPDEFRHEAIAGRLAELALEGETPLDIALFGPWGSGKSSVYELLRRELDGSTARLVRYDAWKFGGASLQRNFISHLANELGFKDSRENRKFHTGLYESRRRALLDFEDLEGGLGSAVLIFMAVFAVFLLVFVALAGTSSIFTDDDFAGQVGKSIPRFIAPTGFVAVVVAAAKVLLDGAKVDVDHAQPAADEEFARTFNDLVELGQKKKGFDRLVVFVDELDRCSPEDVVETLTGIKTFLGHEDCVFIVAADRAVIERALDKLQQATPVDEENPYYSSASSFFDKVFQYRTALPPLRGQRLTRFARDLVSGSEGLWGELRAIDGGRYLDDVIYFLIPSHVRSPRRVKALLNNFALNSRVAGARGIEWLERAPEIAKLTVLQTEFPVLAADLHTEPRLLEFLLDPPDEPSPRVQRLLDRHGRRETTDTNEEEEHVGAAGDEAPDPILADTSDQQEKELGEAEARQLIRYLERTADLPGPGRDLLYLEAAGAAVGLDDPELSELVEIEAPEAPQRVVQAVREQNAETQQGVARMLAQMAEQEFGKERANVMTALMGVVVELGEEVRPVAGLLAPTVRGYQQDRRLGEDHLVGALALALAVPPRPDEGLIDTLFEDERLLETAERVEATAELLDRLPEAHRASVHEAVARLLPEDTDVLLKPLSHLPDAAAETLYGADPVEAAAQAILAGPEAAEFAESLYDAAAAGDASLLRERIQWSLLMHAAVFDQVKAHAEKTLATMDDPQKIDSHVLLALKFAPPEDWKFWTEHLSAGDYSWDVQGRRATNALTTQLDSFHSFSEPGQLATAGLAAALVPFLRMAEEANREKLLDSAQTRLTAATWWQDADTSATQQRLHEALRELEEVDTEMHSRLSDMLVNDLVRAPLQPPTLALETVQGYRELGSKLGNRAADLLSGLPAYGTTAGELAIGVALARATLASAARDGGADIDHTAIDLQEVIDAVEQGAKIGRSVPEVWLRLDPPGEVVLSVIERLGAAPTPLTQAIEAWADRMTSEERIDFAKRLLVVPRDMSKWVGAVCTQEVDDVELADFILDAIQDERSGDRRRELVDALVAIAPSAAAAQRKVADVMAYLLSTGKEVDFRSAQRAAPALGNQHRSAGRLRQAFKTAHEKHGYRVTGRYAQALARAGVDLPKKSLTETAADAVKSIFGRKK
jgi:KAP family P-loop domain